MVRIKATGLNAYDWRMSRGDPCLVRLQQGWRRPHNLVLGADVAGLVVAVGSEVTAFRVGDAVFGCLEGCGRSGLAAGGLAELVAAPQTILALKPASLSFAQAAA
ncbi:MAG: alcohol dehydrogenase catalytic domain-containing protein [Propionibacteriaceae bacterium]|nr:alcohol dehydrogenase catalytic domain-containing protein [Propionibacteriaceae bacterium]